MFKKTCRYFAHFKWFIIVVMLLPLGCGRIESPQPIREYSDFQVLSVKELYLQAKIAALEWQDDAYLYNVTLNVFPATEPLDSSAYFTFRSHAFSEKYFIYHHKEDTTIKVSQSEGEYPMPRSPSLEINPETLPFDSLDAFRIMYDEFGNEIYMDCSIGSWPLLLVLEQRIPGLNEHTWAISFVCSSPQKEGAIIISAETGEVLEIRK